jgi:hypothetical protein
VAPFESSAGDAGDGLGLIYEPSEDAGAAFARFGKQHRPVVVPTNRLALPGITNDHHDNSLPGLSRPQLEAMVTTLVTTFVAVMVAVEAEPDGDDSGHAEKTRASKLRTAG